MTEKINRENGFAAIILILILAIIVLLISILVPVIRNAGQESAREIDQGYEQTAEDSAFMKYAADGHGFTAIYDSEKKEFVDEVGSKREFGSITAYGEAPEHEGKVIMAEVDDDGNITLTWIGQDDYWKVNK